MDILNKKVRPKAINPRGFRDNFHFLSQKKGWSPGSSKQNLWTLWIWKTRNPGNWDSWCFRKVFTRYKSTKRGCFCMAGWEWHLACFEIWSNCTFSKGFFSTSTNSKPFFKKNFSTCFFNLPFDGSPNLINF